MKIFDEDLLLKYDVQIEKNFNIDGSISCSLEAHRDMIEEIIDLFLERNRYNHQITQIKTKNKNYIKYNILFKNKSEIKLDIIEETFDLIKEDININ
jgi:predicted small metal-binding protein